MERIVERVLERQLPSIVARLAASGAATARAETTRSLPSEGGSKLSIFTQFLPSGMMSGYRALTYYCHAGGACPVKKPLLLNNASTAVQPDSLLWLQTPWSQTPYLRLLTQAHQKHWGLQLLLLNHQHDGRSHNHSDGHSPQEPATPKQATNSKHIHNH